MALDKNLALDEKTNDLIIPPTLPKNVVLDTEDFNQGSWTRSRGVVVDPPHTVAGVIFQRVIRAIEDGSYLLQEMYLTDPKLTLSFSVLKLDDYNQGNMRILLLNTPQDTNRHEIGVWPDESLPPEYVGPQVGVTILKEDLGSYNRYTVTGLDNYEVGDGVVDFRLIAPVDTVPDFVEVAELSITAGSVYVPYQKQGSVLVENNSPLLRVNKGRYVVQLLRSKLQTKLGEYLLNPLVGFVNTDDFGRGPDMFGIEMRAREIILSVDDVKSIYSMRTSREGRTYSLTFKAQTTYGEIDLTVPWG